MAGILKQSSTAQPLLFFMTDSSDHITGKTGLSPTVTISKAGGAFASPSGAVSEVANGWYKVAGNATDTGTLGPLVLHATSAGADPSDSQFDVVAFDPQSASTMITGINSLSPPTNWNSLSIDGSGRVDVGKVTGTAQTARDIGASVLLSAGTGTGQLDFTSGVVKANLAQILGTAITETAGQIAAAFKKFFDKSAPTGTVNSLPDAVAGASGGLFIAGSNAATTANITGNITGNLSGSVGSVTGAVGSVTGAVGSVTGAVGSVTGAVGSVSAAVTVGTNNDKTGYTASTVSDKTGYTLSADGVQAIWDALTNALTTVGSIGKRLVDFLTTLVYVAPLNASQVENAVLDATASSHNTAGSVGNKINAAASAGDPWSTAVPGAYGAGTAGNVLGNNLNAQVSAVKAKTDNLPGSPAAVGSAMTLDGATHTAIAADVLDAAAASHNTALSIGNKINSAASSGDPWGTALPGSYDAGTAGYLLGRGVPLNLMQALDTANTGDTVGGGLIGARAQAFGRFSLSEDETTLTVYAADGTTVLHVFHLTG